MNVNFNRRLYNNGFFTAEAHGMFDEICILYVVKFILVYNKLKSYLK